MKLVIYFILMLLTSFSVNASLDCSTKGINKARARSLNLSVKGQHKAAADALAKFAEECPKNIETEEEGDDDDFTKRATLINWLDSD